MENAYQLPDDIFEASGPHEPCDDAKSEFEAGKRQGKRQAKKKIARFREGEKKSRKRSKKDRARAEKYKNQMGEQADKIKHLEANLQEETERRHEAEMICAYRTGIMHGSIGTLKWLNEQCGTDTFEIPKYPFPLGNENERRLPSHDKDTD